MQVVKSQAQDIEPRSFDDIIQKVQVHHKFKIVEVLDKHKIMPNEKAHMNIPFCKMISMPMLRSTLKIDVLKWNGPSI
jgi:hypothetical protein